MVCVAFRYAQSLSVRLSFILAGLLFVLTAATPSLAFNQLLVGTFLDSGVDSLARGGLQKLPRQPELLDFNSPLFLDSKGAYRMETGYEGQLTAEIYNGRWNGSVADSDRLETAVAAPFSLFGDAVKGNVAVGYGFDAYQLKAENTTEDIYIRTNERFDAVKGGLYLTAFQRLSLGISIIDTDYRSRQEIPLELEVAPAPWFRAGYKHSYSDFAASVDLNMMGHDGNLPIKLLETINELYGVVDYRGAYLKYSQELGNSGNRRVEARLALPASMYLVGEYQRREFAALDQGFTVDGTPSGYIKGALRKQAYRAGLGGRLSSRWSVEANYRHSNISFDGGGVASSQAVAGFWPSLVVGNYNYITSASLSADQYHLGGEYQGERFSFGLGMQYLHLKPAAQVEYWRSVFGLGRLGAGTEKLSVERIEMLFLGAGIGYKWKNLEARYAVGQFLPVSVQDTTPEEPSSAPETGAGRRDFFSRVADKFDHYPGGGLHRLLLTVVF